MIVSVGDTWSSVAVTAALLLAPLSSILARERTRVAVGRKSSVMVNVGDTSARLRATSATPMAPVPDTRLTVTSSVYSSTSSGMGSSVNAPRPASSPRWTVTPKSRTGLKSTTSSLEPLPVTVRLTMDEAGLVSNWPNTL